MASPINPQVPIEIGVRQESDGVAKLTLFSAGRKSHEVDCKIVPSGLSGKIHSLYLKTMTDWVAIPYEKFKDRQIFIQKSDLEELAKKGFNIENQAPQSEDRMPDVSEALANRVKGFLEDRFPDVPEDLVNKVEAFFRLDRAIEETQSARFLHLIQDFVTSGEQKLTLDGVFNEEGRCPDIFSSPLFSKLQELSLQGIRDLPSSMRYLKNLTSLDLSHSPMVSFSHTLGELENLEYLNLAFSGINQTSAVTQFGQEYLGGASSSTAYLEEGANKAASELFTQLQPLSKLKAINMVSEQGAGCPSADMLASKFKEARRIGIVNFLDRPNWKEIK